MSVILIPHAVAEECFLIEALMWAGFYRYPTSVIMPDGVDYRFSKGQLDNYQPNLIDDHGYIESDEAVLVGLEPNPAWEAAISDFDNEDEYYFFSSSPEHINQMLSIEGLPKEERQKYKKALPQAEKRKKEQGKWDKAYTEYIELRKAKIFIALKEGELKSFGRPVTLKEKDYDDYGEHKEIPNNFWRQYDIDWKQSALENEKGHFCHIYIETDKLFELFPPPAPEQVNNVSLIADQYVLDEDASSSKIKASKRGRPALDWDAFYLEVMDRVTKKDLPDKQEAFIAEMQEWCSRHWGREVGRSTLLQKISPIYKQHVIK